MAGRFDWALAFVLRPDIEGGWSDNANDSGGVTWKGISLRFVRAIGFDANGDGIVDRKDIADLTDDQVRMLYWEHFWIKVQCDSMPAGVDLLVFDAAINQGPAFAAKALQELVGTKPDGLIGARTKAALIAYVKAHGLRATVNEYATKRAMRYIVLSGFGLFGLGWLRRLFKAHGEAVSPICPN